MRRKSFKQTLIDHVDKRGKNECWPWIGPRRRGKWKYGIATQCVEYGSASTRKRKFWGAHRAYLIFVSKKKVPDDAFVCHTCDNPPCCNPRHLVIADVKWNVRDMIRKGRRVTLRGEEQGMAKLTDKQVAIIKKALKAHIVSVMEMQDRFHVSECAIRNIAEGNRWKHIPPLSPIETVKGNRRPNALSKRLRTSVRKHGMTATARRLHWPIAKLRRLAYPLAPGYEYRKRKM